MWCTVLQLTVPEKHGFSWSYTKMTNNAFKKTKCRRAARAPRGMCALTDRQPLHEWTELMPRSASSAMLSEREAPGASSFSGITMHILSMPKPPKIILRCRAETPRGMSSQLLRGRRHSGVVGGTVDLRKVPMPGGGAETVVVRLSVQSAGYAGSDVRKLSLSRRDAPPSYTPSREARGISRCIF